MKKHIILFILLTTVIVLADPRDWFFFDDDREAPAAPTSLFVGGLQNKDSLTWTDPTALDFDSVRIYRETWYGSGVYSWQYSVAKGVQVKIDSALTPDSVYRYKLYAKDKSGNISSASSTAFDTVKPILYAIDLDGSTEYASKATPELSLDGTYALNETFSDGDYTSGNVWTVSSGSYAVVDSIGYSGLPKSLRCATAGIISIPCNWAYGYVAFDWKKGGDGNNHQIMFVNNVRTFSGASGYEIDLTSGEQYALRRYDNGTPTSIAYSGTSYLRNFTMYRDSIVRNINGSIAVYVKGGIFGSTYTLFSTTGGSGTNPVISNVYTASNYFTLQFSPGDQISNIQCAYGMGSLDLNGHEMVKYPYQNSSFEGGDTTYWTGNGNASIDTTSAGKYAGSYGALLTQSGNGDSTTNYASLTSAQFNIFSVGDKVTIEFWKQSLWTASKDTVVFVWGSKSKKDTIGIYWSKFVYNIQLTSAEIGQDVKIYMISASGDSSRIDGFSITQAWDLMANVWINNNISGTDYICVYGVPGGGAADNNRGYGIYGDGTNVYTIIKGGLGGNTTTEQTAVANSSWTHINIMANRIGNLTISKNGVAETPTSMISVGKISGSASIFIGTYVGALLKYQGQIGETQIVTFDDIATETTWTPSAIYYRSKAGFNFPTSYTGGTIVASYRWIPTDNTVLMNDESASANDLTGTNLTTADSVLLLGY